MHKGNLKIVLIFQLLLKLFECNSLKSGNVIFRREDIFRKNGVVMVCQPKTAVAAKAKYGNLKGDDRTFVMRKVMTIMNIIPFNCYTILKNLKAAIDTYKKEILSTLDSI